MFVQILKKLLIVLVLLGTQTSFAESTDTAIEQLVEARDESGSYIYPILKVGFTAFVLILSVGGAIMKERIYHKVPTLPPASMCQ